MRRQNTAELNALEFLHQLVDEPERQLLFLTDLDGTLVTTPEVKDDKSTLESAHFSSSGRLRHQMARPQSRQTASMQAVADLKANRLLGTGNPDMTFTAVITASGMDRFVDAAGLSEFLQHYASYPMLAGSESNISFLRDDFDYMGQDSRTKKPIFDLVNAAFNKFEITYASDPQTGLVVPKARFSDDNMSDSSIASSVEIYLGNIDPNDLASQIVDLWLHNPGLFNFDSKISKAIAAVTADSRAGRAQLVKAVKRDIEFRVDGVCLHGFDKSSGAREAVREILFGYRSSISKSGVDASVFSEMPLLALNVQADGCKNKIDAFEHTLTSVAAAEKRLIMYCGDTGSDALLMDHLQEKYRNDDTVEVVCIGIGEFGMFRGSADLIVSDIDVFASLLGSLAKSGTLPGTRTSEASLDLIYNPDAVLYSQTQSPHRTRAEQFNDRYGDIQLGDPIRAKLERFAKRAFTVHSPSTSVGAAALQEQGLRVQF